MLGASTVSKDGLLWCVNSVVPPAVVAAGYGSAVAAADFGSVVGCVFAVVAGSVFWGVKPSGIRLAQHTKTGAGIGALWEMGELWLGHWGAPFSIRGRTRRERLQCGTGIV